MPKRDIIFYGEIIDGDPVLEPTICAVSGQDLIGTQDTICQNLTPERFVRYKSRYANRVTSEMIEGWRGDIPKPKKKESVKKEGEDNAR
jgi:hypothetical protein